MTWNIHHGGAKGKLEFIIENISNHNPDIIVLTEFRTNNESYISSHLMNSGYPYRITSNPPEKTNGIFIASKTHIKEISKDYTQPEVSFRWLDVYLEQYDIRILGIHIPGYGDKWGKEQFWQNVIDFALLKKNEKIIMIGDYNTGLKADAEGTPFKCSEYMVKLNVTGWIDSWRYLNPIKKDYTWYSNANNGFRLDYAYITQSLKDRLKAAYHSHEERINKVSDHSSLILEIE
jgi:Exonuclease III